MLRGLAIALACAVALTGAALAAVYLSAEWRVSRVYEDAVSPVPVVETAENLAQRYGISREEVDEYAATSFARAARAWDEGYYDDEVVPVSNQKWDLDGYETRGLRLADRATVFERDGHVRPTDIETLAKLRPAFGGVQTGGHHTGYMSHINH